jgi:hypothetical protein
VLDDAAARNPIRWWAHRTRLEAKYIFDLGPCQALRAEGRPQKRAPCCVCMAHSRLTMRRCSHAGARLWCSAHGSTARPRGARLLDGGLVMHHRAVACAALRRRASGTFYFGPAHVAPHAAWWDPPGSAPPRQVATAAAAAGVGAPTSAHVAGRAPAGPLVAAETAGEAHGIRVVLRRCGLWLCSLRVMHELHGRTFASCASHARGLL